MADGVDEEIEDALQLIVSTAGLSVKMKKEPKQTLLDTVSTLRDLIVKLHVSKDSKTDEISKLEKQVDELKAELDECRHRSVKELGTPSIEENHEPAGKSARSVAPPSGRDGKHTESDRTTGKRVAPPGGA
jgi:chromosome segregation ATPase